MDYFASMQFKLQEHTFLPGLYGYKIRSLRRENLYKNRFTLKGARTESKRQVKCFKWLPVMVHIDGKPATYYSLRRGWAPVGGGGGECMHERLCKKVKGGRKDFIEHWGQMECCPNWCCSLFLTFGYNLRIVLCIIVESAYFNFFVNTRQTQLRKNLPFYHIGLDLWGYIPV